MLDNPLTKQRIYVADTSYLVGLFLRMMWTLRMQQLMEADNAPSVMPLEVTREFEDLYRCFKNTPYDLSHWGSGLEQKLRTNSSQVYKILISQGIPIGDSPKNENHKGPDPLTIADRTLVEEVVTLAREGKVVYAATSDYGIVKALNEIRDRENLELIVVSPWNAITKEGFIPLELRLLVMNGVFEDLYNINQHANDQKYLAVAKEMELGFGVKCDVAFGIYTKIFMYKHLPAFDGVYFIPLIFPEIHENKILIGGYYLGFARFAEVVAYNPSSPATVHVFQQNPLPPKYLHRLLMILKKRKMTDAEADKALSHLQIKVMNWARIEDWHLGKLNKTTLGIVSDLRDRLQKKH